MTENNSTGLYLPEAKIATVAADTASAIKRSIVKIPVPPNPANQPNSATTFPTPPTMPPS